MGSSHSTSQAYKDLVNRELYSPTITEPAKIQDYLYLGGEEAARNPTLLHQVGITHVLNITKTPIWNEYGQNIIRKNILIDDLPTENIRQYFEEAFRFIDEARFRNGRVFVHCAMGISRSPTIVIAYLMLRYRFRLDVALTFVRTRRPQIMPNPGFMEQLRQFDADLKQANVYKNNSFHHAFSFPYPNRLAS